MTRLAAPEGYSAARPLPSTIASDVLRERMIVAGVLVPADALPDVHVMPTLPMDGAGWREAARTIVEFHRFDRVLREPTIRAELRAAIEVFAPPRNVNR